MLLKGGEKLNVFSRFKSKLARNPTKSNTKFQLISQAGEHFTDWNGHVFESDIIRACTRPFSKAVGKLVGKHIKETTRDLKINPDPYMKMLLEEPNSLMSGQVMLEKVAYQFKLNKNAFILIHRDENGFPIELYPLPAVSVEADNTEDGVFWLKFRFNTGKFINVPYSDVIHLREDFYDGEVFGSSINQALLPLMQVINISDQSIVSAVKNSKVIKWLMKFTQTLRPEDMEINVKKFAETYLATTGDGIGVAASDSKYDLQQVKQDDFVPQSESMNSVFKRVYALFNTNEKIIHSNYNEDEWNAYYESEIEPFATQLSNEYTRKLFTKKDRGKGNRIFFESSNLQYASMKTKLNLLFMVDRGAMTPNEWRKVMNYGPIEGGDEVVRRLDTAVVEEGVKEDDNSKGGEKD